MKKTALIILSVLICCTAFAKKQKHKKKHKSAGPITSVIVHRTGCFGRCPDYTVEINADGMATYTGIRFNTDSGVYKKDIGATKAMNIINEFITYRVDTCSDRYHNRIEDLPGLILTINYKDSVKTIQNAHFGPPYLRTLAADVDNAGKRADDSWKKAVK